METLSREIQQIILNGVNKEIKVGYFWKYIRQNEDYATYTNEKIYPTHHQLIESIVQSKTIKDEIIKQVENCKDALEVCEKIKKNLCNYEETCDMEIDICFTCVYK